MDEGFLVQAARQCSAPTNTDVMFKFRLVTDENLQPSIQYSSQYTNTTTTEHIPKTYHTRHNRANQTSNPTWPTNSNQTCTTRNNHSTSSTSPTCNNINHTCTQTKDHLTNRHQIVPHAKCGSTIQQSTTATQTNPCIHILSQRRLIPTSQNPSSL